MKVDECIEYAERLKNINPELLIVKIGEISKKHWNNEKLTVKEKFIIGLRYSEFLAEGNSDEDHYQAVIKQQSVLKILNINFQWIIDSCIRICGLH